MKKLLCLMTLCLLMAGCKDGLSIKQEYVGYKTVCINGHLYYDHSPGITPLFDWRTDRPTLIQCPNIDKDALLTSKKDEE